MHNILIILDRPFLNSVGVVINYNKSKVTFHANGKKHMIHFSKKQNQMNSINFIEKIMTVAVGSFESPLTFSKGNIKLLLIEPCIFWLR